MNHSLEIEAGTHAFGDGQHPTTRGVLIMLSAMDSTELSPRIACDMGAGSGILAMAMALRFLCPVVSVDIEASAVAAMRLNAERNGIPLRIQTGAASILPLQADGFRHLDIIVHAPYDVIVANMLAAPLIALAHAMVQHLAPGGALIMSGILLWQETALCAAYEALGLELASRVVIGEWVTLGWGKTISKPKRAMRQY